MPILIWSTHPLAHTWTSRSKMVFYFDMTWTDVGDLMAITSLPSSSSRFDSILASLDTSVQFLSVDVSILSCWLARCMNGGGWIGLFGCCCCCRWIELVFKPCFKFVVAWSHNDALYQYNKQMEWSMRKKIDYTLLSVKFAIEKKQIFFCCFDASAVLEPSMTIIIILIMDAFHFVAFGLFIIVVIIFDIWSYFTHRLTGQILAELCSYSIRSVGHFIHIIHSRFSRHWISTTTTEKIFFWQANSRPDFNLVIMMMISDDIEWYHYSITCLPVHIR